MNFKGNAYDLKEDIVWRNGRYLETKIILFTLSL